MAYGVHAYVDDPRNADILIAVNDTLAPPKEAVVSVFDAGFVLGDGVWEGLRLHKGGIPFLWAHLERLYEGAKALDFSVGLTPDARVKRSLDCGEANGMEDGVPLRLMVTRGIKATAYQDPRVTIGD